jgi:hypothetical protein
MSACYLIQILPQRLSQFTGICLDWIQNDDISIMKEMFLSLHYREIKAIVFIHTLYAILKINLSYFK